ncbi:MAG: adenylosuccinate lyase, partial [Methanoregula sp.]
MAVHPIEERYGTREMRAVWSEQNRFSCIVRAEIALAHAEAVCGMIPPTAAEEIEQNAPSASLARAKEIELEIIHDMMAIVKSISAVTGGFGSCVHDGAQSSVILDTPPAPQHKDSIALLYYKHRRLLAVLL